MVNNKNFTLTVVLIFAAAMFSNNLITDTSSPTGKQIQSQGIDYYICDCAEGAHPNCIPGDDSNSGTSVNSPWRTWNKARTKFNNLNPGETIAFCRGGAFDTRGAPGNERRWNNDKCEANKRCTITAYSSKWGGSTAEPIVTSDNIVFNLAKSGHEEGYNILNLNLKGEEVGSAIFLMDQITDVTLDNLKIDGFLRAVQVAGDATGIERIYLKNSRILNNGDQGWVGGCKECIIKNNYFENNGFINPILDHSIYFSGENGDSDNSIIANNEIYHSNSNEDGLCDGTSLVVHGNIKNLTIERNYFHENESDNGCWGISVNAKYAIPDEQFDNLIIRRNRLINMGAKSIGCESCTNSIIENNLIISNSEGYSVTGIEIPNQIESPDDISTRNVQVRGNTIYFGQNTRGTGIYLGDEFNNPEEGGEFISTNNIVYYEGTNNDFKCFTYDLPLNYYTEIDNNICYTPNAPNSKWVGGLQEYQTLAEWQTNTNFGDNSLNTDPFLSNPPENLHLRATSPAIDAGHPIYSSTEDYDKQPRIPPADIGADEYYYPQ